MKTLTKLDAGRARDAIVRAVRQQTVEQDRARATLTLPRTCCPALTDSSWNSVNAALPIGWNIEDITASTFTLVVVGRRAA